ncbi:MAG: hypothetical protein RL711_1823 [Bacteroidota bacterium]
MNQIKIIVILLFFSAPLSFAQEANLSQFYNFSTSINPSFCGATPYSRVNFGARNQWIALNKGYNTSYVGFDHYLKPYYSGLGGFIKYDRSPSGYTNLQIQGQFSHLVQVGSKSALRAGIQIGLNNNQFEFSNLLFGDQISNDGKQSANSIEENNGLGIRKTHLDLGIGLLYYTDKYWIGASASHLNKPNVGFGNTSSTLPISFNLHTGARIYVGREKGIQREVRKTFSPAMMVRNSFNRFQFDFTGIYNLQPLLLGFGYRGLPILKYDQLQNDALMLLVGYKSPTIMLAYAYDLTISSLGLSTLGSHEISVVIEFGDRVGSFKKGSRLINTPFPILYSN